MAMSYTAICILILYEALLKSERWRRSPKTLAPPGGSVNHYVHSSYIEVVATRLARVEKSMAFN